MGCVSSKATQTPVQTYNAPDTPASKPQAPVSDAEREEEERLRLQKEKEENDRREREEVLERERRRAKEVKKAKEKEEKEAEKAIKARQKEEKKKAREQQKAKEMKEISTNSFDDDDGDDGLDKIINNLGNVHAERDPGLAPLPGGNKAGNGMDFNRTSDLKEKCFTVALNGCGGENSGFNTWCTGLHCRGCDMGIARFENHKWDDTVDYLFFRNFHPNREKLAPKMIESEGTAAYCCQCSWRNIDSRSLVQDDRELKWFCVGH